jgi:hypothetical protein
MDWSGSGPPDSPVIAGCGILAQGSKHVAAMSDTASVILGWRDLEFDRLTGRREVTHRAGGTVWLYQGGQRLSPAAADGRRTLPVMSVWGLSPEGEDPSGGGDCRRDRRAGRHGSVGPG